MTATRNPFAFPAEITLDTLPDLLAFHRLTFGGYRMEDPPPTGNGPPNDPPSGNGFQPIASQDELDRIIGQRLAREREKYADYDQLKAAAEEYAAAKDAAKTEQERAVEAARREGETSALERANGRLVAAEARALAAEAKFAKPELAVRALDLSDVKVGDDGAVDAEAIRSKLTELAESGAFVIGEPSRPNPKPDRSQGGGGTPDAPGVNRGREMFLARKGTKTA